MNIFTKNNGSELSFKSTLRLVGIPIVTLENNGNQYNFILDTGATTSLINSDIIDNLSNKKPVDGEDIVSGLNPNVKYKAQRYIIQFNNKKERFYHKFSVFNLNDTFNDLEQESGILVHGLLGSDFLRDKKYILDYNKQVAYRK